FCERRFCCTAQHYGGYNDEIQEKLTKFISLNKFSFAWAFQTFCMSFGALLHEIDPGLPFDSGLSG
ncbi:hypothetical protein, partial [Flavobacterium sp.]|uniref:hypothetical protein n=1 Tax=Flavobacterium sp. TaxID=239 RepID=UPI0037BE70F7